MTKFWVWLRSHDLWCMKSNIRWYFKIYFKILLKQTRVDCLMSARSEQTTNINVFSQHQPGQARPPSLKGFEQSFHLDVMNLPGLSDAGLLCHDIRWHKTDCVHIYVIGQHHQRVLATSRHQDGKAWRVWRWGLICQSRQRDAASSFLHSTELTLVDMTASLGSHWLIWRHGSHLSLSLSLSYRYLHLSYEFCPQVRINDWRNFRKCLVFLTFCPDLPRSPQHFSFVLQIWR